jgi:hypothetical protein
MHEDPMVRCMCRAICALFAVTMRSIQTSFVDAGYVIIMSPCQHACTHGALRALLLNPLLLFYRCGAFEPYSVRHCDQTWPWSSFLSHV